jgi:hypothetical protein
MVFEQRPEELFAEVVQRGLAAFKTTIEGVSQVIRTGDETLRELDDALTGSRPRFGETPQESFMSILDMLHGTLEDAREKQSASAPSVTQKAREILARINAVEPAWRPGPLSRTTPGDLFRAALRDLRASNSMIRMAQGTGTLDDLKGLSDWADDVNTRIEQLKAPATPQPEVTPQKAEEPKTKAKRAKKDTTPKAKPEPDDVAFALAVAEEFGDKEVKGWVQEFADGKISEAQWINRLTTHAAATRESLDDVLARAEQRIARERNANKQSPTEEK